MKSKIIPILGTALLALLLASCDVMFQGKIPKPGDSDGNSLDDLFRSADVITKLATPSQLYIAPYYSSTEIRLTWNEVNGAAYYTVERAVAELVPGSDPARWEEPNEGDYEPLELGRFVYDTSYTDQILRFPTLDSPEYDNRYYYRISALNPAMRYEESDPTTPEYAMLFRAPSGLRASGGTSTEYVEVTWDEAPGAKSYEIFRSYDPNGTSNTKVGEAPNVLVNRKIRFTDRITNEQDQGVDLYYMVRALNSGNNSLITRPAYGYTRMVGAPDDPQNVRLVTGSGRGHSVTDIKIEWDPSSDPDVYFAVYRYNEKDSSLTRLTGKTTNAIWTDSYQLKPGIFYYYRVQAIKDGDNDKQLKSAFSDPAIEGYLLSCPEEVYAEKSGGNITIKWSPAKSSTGERSLFSYNVYADPSVNGSFTNKIASKVSANVQNGYIFTSVSGYNGQYFKITTINTLDIESEKSGAVTTSPDAAVILEASERAFISASENANANGVYPVRITWKKPPDDDPVYYQVQRSEKSGGGFSRINSAPLSADGSGGGSEFSYDPATGVYTYLDRYASAKVGKKYYYRVLSLNSLEQGSFYSEEKIGWGALTHVRWLIEYDKTLDNACFKKLTLMNRPAATDKLGEETKPGTISGSVSYSAKMQGLGAAITIRFTDYADFYIENNSNNGPIFIMDGQINTTADMSQNGSQNATIAVTGMYPGTVYHNLVIKGGSAGGGSYGVVPDGGYPRVEVDWSVIN